MTRLVVKVYYPHLVGSRDSRGEIGRLRNWVADTVAERESDLQEPFRSIGQEEAEIPSFCALLSPPPTS